MVGVAKTGMPGLGILVIPLMVLAVGDARLSAGWLLPILCAADVFAIYYFRRHAAASRLFSLAPWVLVGMMLGGAALGMAEGVLRVVVALIIVVMLGIALLRRYNNAPPPEARLAAATYGAAAGFATTVANAAGPVMNAYLLSHRLPKEEFVATGAWFFFVVNLLKVPLYHWHGLFSARSLAFDVVLLPAIAVGALTGRALMMRVPQRLFDFLVTVLTVISTALLFVPK
jgi:uncharacterized membrane protein YfcA